MPPTVRPAMAQAVMTHYPKPKVALLIRVMCVCALIAAGCGAKETPPPAQQHHIRGLWHIYMEFLRAHQGTAPKNADELKTWARENLTSDRLQLMGVPSLDEAFMSPRDQQPYVVRAVKSSDIETALKPGDISKRPPVAPVAIYEAKGVNGRRYVAYAFGEVAELPEAMLQRMLPPDAPNVPR